VQKYREVLIADLKPDPKNARKHGEKNLAAIKASLEQFGQQRPIVCTPEGVVVAGNGTMAAAQALGWTSLQVVYTDLKGKKLKAFALADNRTAELAEWDDTVLNETLKMLKDDGFDIGSIGFDFTMDDTPAVEGQCDEDDVPEQVETRCKPGDLWVLGNHRLLCGDSTNVQHVERLMGGEKADLWLTDPPYGVAYNGKTKDALEIKNDAMPLEEMSEFWTALAASALIATTARAPYYWFACQGGDQMMMMMMMSIGRAGWKVRHELIWVKDALVLSRCDYHYKHEPILYGWKQEGVHEFYGDRSQTSVLEFARPKRNDVHPTMKPVELIAYLLGNSSKPGGKVLDTCLGSGTTMLASEKTGRRCFGMELDPKYCDVILARWEAFTGKTASLSDDRPIPQDERPAP
jgi:DNA modification methylase